MKPGFGSTAVITTQAIYGFGIEISVGSIVIKMKDKRTRSVHSTPVVALKVCNL